MASMVFSNFPWNSIIPEEYAGPVGVYLSRGELQDSKVEMEYPGLNRHNS